AALNAADPLTASSFAVRVLTTLAGVDDRGFEQLVDSLSNHAETDRAATILMEAARELLSRSRPGQALICARAVAAEDRFAAGENRAAALTLEGVALTPLGRVAEALARLDGAIDQLIGTEDLDLVKALINRANALQSLREFARAERDY